MIIPDIPISNSMEDSLNRSSFAENLAKAILQSNFPSSFAIGLYGEWGSGKTSLLNMVFESIQVLNHDVITFKFNPWLCSDSNQLIAQFFKQMAAAIGLKKTVPNQVWKKINQYADIFDATKAVPVVGPVLAAMSKTLVSEAERQVEQEESNLQEIKNHITQKMEEANVRLVISIDDIDRLSEEEIIAVFQLVKALGDFPNTIYLLAFDFDVVVQALDRVQQGKGREYLEKVVQVPFQIPAPDMENIHEILFSKLNTILKNVPTEKWDKIAWFELFQFGISKYVQSIRDVIRYTNVFSLKYGLLRDETDVVDLLGLTCLQVFEPGVYARLPHYKDVLCGWFTIYSSETIKSEEEEVRKAVGSLLPSKEAAENDGAARKILGLLFPKTNTVHSGFNGMGRQYSHKSFLRNNKISVSACFDRYFSLTLEKDAISTPIIEHLIYKASENEFIVGVKKIYNEGKIGSFLEKLNSYASKEGELRIPSDRASLVVGGLARLLHLFEVDEREFFSVPFSWQFLSCADLLFKCIEKSQCYPYICSIFTHPQVQPTTLALLLRDFEVQHGRFGEEVPENCEPAISLEEVLELEQIFKNRAIEALDSKEVFKYYHGLGFLWALEQIDRELVQSIKESLVTDDISLVKIISYNAYRGSAAVRIVTKTRKVNLQKLSEFVNLDEAYTRIQKFVQTKDFSLLLKDEQMDVATFILAMERGCQDSVEDGFISEDIIQNKLCELLI